jgi:hypothetical protein
LVAHLVLHTGLLLLGVADSEACIVAADTVHILHELVYSQLTHIHYVVEERSLPESVGVVAVHDSMWVVALVQMALEGLYHRYMKVVTVLVQSYTLLLLPHFEQALLVVDPDLVPPYVPLAELEESILDESQTVALLVVAEVDIEAVDTAVDTEVVVAVADFLSQQFAATECAFVYSEAQ